MSKKSDLHPVFEQISDAFGLRPKSKPMHTAGPWKFLDLDDDYISVTDSEQQYGICRLHADYSESRPAQLANAHLIANAPNLLKELEGAAQTISAIIDHFDVMNVLPSQKVWCESMSDDLKTELLGIHTAIARAKGEW